jgi:hypothetical protein
MRQDKKKTVEVGKKLFKCDMIQVPSTFINSIASIIMNTFQKSDYERM